MNACQTKNPDTAGGGPGFQNQLPISNSTRKPKKWKRVLEAFLAGRSLNRFESARQLHDHCLHSTVSGLEARGIRINRRDEVVPGQYGAVHCKRYQLAPESRTKAAALLGISGDRNAVP